MITPLDLKKESFTYTEYPSHLERVYSLWETINQKFWQGVLKQPYIVLGHFDSFLGCVLPYHSGTRILLDVNQIVFCYLNDKYAVIEQTILHESIHQFLREQLGQKVNNKNCHAQAFSNICNFITRKIGHAERFRSMRTWTRKTQHEKGILPCIGFPFYLYPEIQFELKNIQARKFESRARTSKSNKQSLSFVIAAFRRIEEAAAAPIYNDLKVIADYLNIKTETEELKVALFQKNRIEPYYV